MNDSEKYILDAIKVRVWGGFDNPEDVQDMISDILEEDANEEMLRSSVIPEFEKKYEAEKDWPSVTDVDRLGEVFKTLWQRGILCLHNAGYTMSDGHSDANEELARHEKGRFHGYCFYHGQDLERAVHGQGLMLAYDHVDGDVPDKIKVAQAIRDELTKLGFPIDWDGTTNKRINLPQFKWLNRSR